MSDRTFYPLLVVACVLGVFLGNILPAPRVRTHADDLAIEGREACEAAKSKCVDLLERATSGVGALRGEAVNVPELETARLAATIAAGAISRHGGDLPVEGLDREALAKFAVCMAYAIHYEVERRRLESEEWTHTGRVR